MSAETLLHNLGLSSYRDVWEMQRTRQQQIIHAQAPEIIYMTEHQPVYTLGRHGNPANLLSLPPGTECVPIERGGDITYHAPGQTVVYPLISLWRRRLGVKDYVNALEQWVIDTLSDFGLEGCRSDGAPGVWLQPSTPRRRKICALGVKVTRGVTMHGFALNADIDLSGFRHINPCGFTSAEVTSIAAELGHSVGSRSVREALERHIPEMLIPLPMAK